MKVIFWCEFPNQINFKRLNEIIDFRTEVYFAVRSLKEFNGIKNKIKNRNITAGAWPILKKEEGYWFSGFISKKSIDRLEEFKWQKIKIDVEPPIYNGRHSLLKDIYWFIKYTLLKGKNNNYLIQKLESAKLNAIMSGFLLPCFIRKRYGDSCKTRKKNYICYTTFFPRFLRGLARIIYFISIKNMDKSNTFYAIGLTNPGIFENEPEYETIMEFKKDIKMMKKAGVKNLCVYSIEGILKRKNAREWLEALR